ncbi:hypothetical protein AB832_06390 [Flavobacteriaceae bacterium (ex Bugula neritina AB1)]|nr:hypothetical protein AB832_06390 [Flavobacteriaceae bacterium (ex Bugula neritina AB1)]
MINTKNLNIDRYIFYIFFLTGLFSCKNQEHLTFETKIIAIQDFFDCQTTDCVTTEILLLKSVNETKISKRVNQEIEKAACIILNMENNAPAKTIDAAIRRFNLSYQQTKKEFPDEITPYEISINCHLSFQNQEILSVLIESYIYTGGAHGNGNSTYLTIHAKTGKLIKPMSLFKNYNEFLNYSEKVFRQKHTIGDHKSINSTGFFFENDQFTLPANIGFTDRNVILFYNQYEISSYAEGPVELKLEKEKVSDFFSFPIL